MAIFAVLLACKSIDRLRYHASYKVYFENAFIRQ